MTVLCVEVPCCSTAAPSAPVQNLTYAWDRVGNLKQRADVQQNLTEEFYYDSLNRLDCSTLNIAPQASCAALTSGQMNLNVDYNALGNITFKTGLDNYTYDAVKKHRMTSTSLGGHAYVYDANGNMTSRDGFGITWFSYNLPNTINGAGGSSSQFYYTAQRERWKQVASYGGTPETTIYIGGLIEKVTLGSVTSWRHYIAGGSGAVAVYTRKSAGADELHYLTRDHLGSVDSITNSTGGVETLLSYGAFGERRNATGWTGNPTAATWTEITDGTRRGFTFHEMPDNLNLTHMNGRVYDQISGRFLSADPFVPDPGFTQSFNRYSYVYNNPLRYTDPSGFQPSPDDTPPGNPNWCNRICIDFTFNVFGASFGQDLFVLRLRSGTPPPTIGLRGRVTVVPVKRLETDIAGGEVKKRSTNGGAWHLPSIPSWFVDGSVGLGNAVSFGVGGYLSSLVTPNGFDSESTAYEVGGYLALLSGGSALIKRGVGYAGAKILGTAQPTGTLGHAFVSRVTAYVYAFDPRVARVTLNLGYSKLMAGTRDMIYKYGPRPDVGVLYKSGYMKAVEIASKTDDYVELVSRNARKQAQEMLKAHETVINEWAVRLNRWFGE